MTVTKSALNAVLKNPITRDGQFRPEFIRILQDIISDRKINTGTAQPRTISSGAIAILPNYSYYSVDTESAAASDNLDTISNGNEGDLIFIKASSDARTVVIRDSVGNIKTNGSVNLSLDSADDMAILHYDGSAWKCDLWDIG